MIRVADNLWVLRYPLRLLGVSIGRTVTVIRLANGKLVIHSTAPFTSEDVHQMEAIGNPEWLLDVSCFHDSLAEEGRRAFPNLRYLVPQGFPRAAKLRAQALEQPPLEWGAELQMREVAGMPSVCEHALFHVPSRTLIVADMLFNFGGQISGLTKFLVRHVLRFKSEIGMSPFFRSMIRDRAAFKCALGDILRWDFDRIVVAHGEIIETDGKQRLRAVLHAHHLDPSG